MDDIGELVEEVAKAQMHYDITHEQGCATFDDEKRLTDAKTAVVDKYTNLLGAREYWLNRALTVEKQLAFIRKHLPTATQLILAGILSPASFDNLIEQLRTDLEAVK